MEADIGFYGGPSVLPLIDSGKPVVVLAGVHPICWELFASDRVRGMSRHERPAAVVRAAKKHLAKLEQEAASRSPQGDLFSVAPQSQVSEPHPAMLELQETDPDSLSPRQALELVYRLSKLSRDKH